MLTTMEDIANALNMSTDASTFSTQASAVKTAFNNAFFNASAGHYAARGDSGYRQTHNLLALAYNLASNTTVQSVADSIADDVATKQVHLNTGALGTKYILTMLTTHGHADTALAVAQQTTFPSWGFWIANGATTMWEHWALAARSRDHVRSTLIDKW